MPALCRRYLQMLPQFRKSHTRHRMSPNSGYGNGCVSGAENARSTHGRGSSAAIPSSAAASDSNDTDLKGILLPLVRDGIESAIERRRRGGVIETPRASSA